MGPAATTRELRRPARELTAWPASDGLVVGGVADGLGDAPAIDDGWDVAAGGCNATEPHPVRSPTTTAATNARITCKRPPQMVGYAARDVTRASGVQPWGREWSHPGLRVQPLGSQSSPPRPD